MTEFLTRSKLSQEEFSQSTEYKRRRKAMTTTNNNPAIEEARAYAHEAIEEAYPQTIEVEDATDAMYEFDAIIIDDELCDVAEIAIMHDFGRNTFALVERPRINEAVIHEAEKHLRIAELLEQAELKVFMLSMQCETEEEITAAWAAITSTTSQSMRNRLHEIGGDVDSAIRNTDRYLLTNPQ